jgi:HNH endonuclease
MQYIPLTKGKFAIVDDEDYERIDQWKWHASRGDRRCDAVRKLAHDNRIHTRRMHHEVLKLPLAEGQKWVVDHINRNPLDNRKANLRVCTAQQNTFNSGPSNKKGKTSYYKGVSFYRCHKLWTARVHFKGRTYYLGYFKTEYEAMVAYNLAVVKKVGEYAYVNRWRGPTLPPPAGAEKSLQRYYAQRDFSPPDQRRKPKIDPKRLPPGIQLCFDFYYEEERQDNRIDRIKS